MITKAILELNACVKTLEYFRKNRKRHPENYYHEVCSHERTYVVFGSRMIMFEIEQVLEMLSKATKGTSKEILTEEEAADFAFRYINHNNTFSAEEIAEYCGEAFDNIRRCSVCGRLMQEGYCEDGGWRYYCSDECLHTKYSDAEWEEECENNENSYWTTWD